MNVSTKSNLLKTFLGLPALALTAMLLLTACGDSSDEGEASEGTSESETSN